MSEPAHTLLGKYHTPRFRYGDSAFCEVRGEVVITAESNGKIPWPLGKRPGNHVRGFVVFGDLAEALRQESATAICYWWGVSPETVSHWRKEMGIRPMTQGTALLRSKSAKDSPGVAKALKLAHAKSGDPDRRRKIAESRRGKPRPAHVIEAVRMAHLGKKASEETRRKLSEAQRKRGAWPPAAGRPWSETELALLGKVTDEVLAKRMKRPVSAIRAMRNRLRIRMTLLSEQKSEN